MHHLTMNFKIPSFIVSLDSVSKLTPGKLANVALVSIKVLGFFGFQVFIVVENCKLKTILSLKEF